MATEEFRYVSIATHDGKVISFHGWDARDIISWGMDETEALNLLGKLGYRPYMVTDRLGVKGQADKEPVITTFRLCNRSLPQVV